MTSVAALSIYMWSILVFANGEPDYNTIIKSEDPYESMQTCQQGLEYMSEMIDTNEELNKRMLDAGYLGIYLVCTDNPDPFKQGD